MSLVHLHLILYELYVLTVIGCSLHFIIGAVEQTKFMSIVVTSELH